jgi:hypothetical protein
MKLALLFLLPLVASGQQDYFPSRLHKFVFRNWELANLERIAQVAATSPQNISAVGRSMGLPPKIRLTEDQLRRIYITAIRQNWDVLPEQQLIQLLGWTMEKYRFTLKEDDFLDVKLGAKPKCEPIRYEGGKADASWIRRTLGRDLHIKGEPPFEFVKRLSAPSGKFTPAAKSDFHPRYIYSFFALYGDPLLEPEIDPFPDGYLEKLAESGVDGVWMQCVLNTMAPSKQFPEFGKGWEKRLETLNKLVARAGKYGIKIYLYLNEPRSMPSEFFEHREEIKGAKSGGNYAMCTTPKQVREWISDSLNHVFTHVSGLGGVFSITMSENLTNCFSKGGAKTCPRCSKRTDWETVGEVLEAIREGVRRSSKDAEVIVWDWGWPEPMARNLIPKLARDMKFMSVSEWSKPIERAGVKTQVGEYSISVVGPGPRATEHWALARAAGLKTMAKVQFNNTWEISAVPFIPALNLVERHARNLKQAGISGIQLSWTLGGYPSPNLEAAKRVFDGEENVLRSVAEARYGKRAAPLVLDAWKGFSDAFERYPYSVSIYTIPTQHGPANLLRLTPSGIRSSMILFPQDDYKSWSGKYPPATVQREFAGMAEAWLAALNIFRRAVPEDGEDFAIAETCYIHFRSVANQIEFYLLRDNSGSRERMRAIAAEEEQLARRMYKLARRHSVLAYEASNHYYYRPLDLAEKILNCRWIQERLAGD